MAIRSGILLAAASLLMLGACEPIMATRGNLLDNDKLAEIKAGTSTREDVVAKLGTPTAVGTFDENAWYYFGEETKQYSFLDPEVLKHEAVEVHFDDQGTVTKIAKLNPDDAEAITPVSETTPTNGQETTMMQQLLGSLSHPGIHPKIGN